MLHHGFSILAWFLRHRLLPELARFAGPMQRAASLFERIGSDRGAMMVRVSGRLADGRPVERRWTLIVQAGDGPFIPGIPASILIGKLSRGEVNPSARPALSVFTLAEVEAVLSRLDTQFHREENPPRLFEATLGSRWSMLPAELRDMHDLWDMHSSTGHARIERGRHPAAHIVAALFRFPRAGPDVPVSVTMTRERGGEAWIRAFAGCRFTSHLTPAGSGEVDERFGPFSFLIALTERPGGFGMVVTRASFLGIPVPRAMLPRSDTAQFVENGCFTFDVRLSLPVAGLLVHYRGWLLPDTEARTTEP